VRNAELDYDAYGQAVLAGEIVVCKWVRLAIERHYRDLESGHERGIQFVPELARHALSFFDYLRHSKDEWAGKPFILEPWQAWCTAVIFGWVRVKDGTRRFRKAYLRVARKNGKTTWLAGIGLYLTAGDGVAGAEVYTVATKLEQAKLIHSESELMVRMSPALKRHLMIYKNKIFLPNTSTKYVPLGADADTQDGLNPHGTLIDELHAHTTSKMWDIMQSATGARSQPLTVAITTAGFNSEETICVIQDNHIKAVLEQAFEDDNYFGIIYELDDEDDWKNPEVWIKANPSLGGSVKIDNLAEDVLLAVNQPSSLTNLLTKRMNRWVKSSNLWMPMDKWRACKRAFSYDDLKGASVVFGGLDLASVSDMCGFAMLAIMPDGQRRAFIKSYLPEDAALDKSSKNRILYERWARQGFLTLTPGNVVDYNWIKKDILQACEDLPIHEVAFDRWNSSQLVSDLLEEGVPMVGFGQGYVSMNPAMLDLERLILGKTIEHDGNPVLTWAMGNLVATSDPAGSIKPDKAKSTNKIDAAVALIMANGRAMAFVGEADVMLCV
jgi:phage terminase large subunit-like protein